MTRGRTRLAPAGTLALFDHTEVRPASRALPTAGGLGITAPLERHRRGSEVMSKVRYVRRFFPDGTGMTPLLDCPRLAHALGIRRLLVKDESQLPTGSFKSRGMAVAVSMAQELGIRRLAIPTAGNAGGALAAYAARAGMECFVFSKP